MNKRREFPDRIKAQIIKRAMNERGLLVCEGCGGILKPKTFEIDHVIPEGLVVDKSRGLAAEDGQLLGPCCHRGENGKTARDVARIAKAKRQERGHLGIKKPSTWRKPPPGFQYDWRRGRYTKETA